MMTTDEFAQHYEACWLELSAQYPQLSKPTYMFRKMRTALGRAHYTQGKITFNPLLLEMNEAEAKHVIFHELSHFVCPHHKREFYDVLDEFDPLHKANMEKAGGERLQKLQELCNTLKLNN